VIKRILSHLEEEPGFVEMFLREARLCSQLTHANIVQVIELGELDGEHFLAMEYVHGLDLSALSKALRHKAAPDPGLGAFVLCEIARALGYAHAATDDHGRPLRLVHRDVSPSNIMLGSDGSVKLLDFGIAKAFSEVGDQRTQSGLLRGKVGYMAPELVNGFEIDHRADLFAVGVILHETLSGQRLFKGESDVKTLQLVREGAVEPPSRINSRVLPALDRICLRALARDPAERYQSGSELADELGEVVHLLRWGPERLATLLRELQPESIATPVSTPGVDSSNDSEATVSGSHAAARAARSPWLGRRLAISGLGMCALVAVAWLAGRPTSQALPAAENIARATAPALPPTITVHVSTTPSDAEVRVEEEDEPRGRTPLVFSLPRSSSARRISVSAPGRQTLVTQLTPDADCNLQLALAPLPPAKVAAERPASTKRRPTEQKLVREAPVPASKHVTPAVTPLRKGQIIDPFAP
jgi:serine/threonine-protein kinase